MTCNRRFKIGTKEVEENAAYNNLFPNKEQKGLCNLFHKR
jgi:hypothetical protein